MEENVANSFSEACELNDNIKEDIWKHSTMALNTFTPITDVLTKCAIYRLDISK